MLNKLIKQEFRATARIMLPLMLALVLLSVISGFAIRYLDIYGGEYALLSVLSAFSLVMFVIAIIAVAVSALIIMIQRFYKNLYGDEGYLMFTLPVSTDSLIWSKLIVSGIWFILTWLLCVASVLILMSFDEPQMFCKLTDILKSGIEEVGAGNMTAFFAEFIIYFFLSFFGTCLHFYLAIALGHCASSHKILMSVLAFFGISIAFRIISTGIGISLMNSGAVEDFLYGLEDGFYGYSPVYDYDMSTANVLPYIHGIAGISIFISLLINAIMYIPTRLLMKKKLNLG